MNGQTRLVQPVLEGVVMLGVASACVAMGEGQEEDRHLDSDISKPLRQLLASLVSSVRWSGVLPREREVFSRQTHITTLKLHRKSARQRGHQAHPGQVTILGHVSRQRPAEGLGSRLLASKT